MTLDPWAEFLGCWAIWLLNLSWQPAAGKPLLSLRGWPPDLRATAVELGVCVDLAPSPLPVTGNPMGPMCLEENNPETGEGQGASPSSEAGRGAQQGAWGSCLETSSAQCLWSHLGLV